MMRTEIACVFLIFFCVCALSDAWTESGNQRMRRCRSDLSSVIDCVLIFCVDGCGVYFSLLLMICSKFNKTQTEIN